MDGGGWGTGVRAVERHHPNTASSITLRALKPGAPGQPLLESFERKFVAHHAKWSREADQAAEWRAVEDVRRAEELLAKGISPPESPSTTAGRGYYSNDSERPEKNAGCDRRDRRLRSTGSSMTSSPSGIVGFPGISRNSGSRVQRRRRPEEIVGGRGERVWRDGEGGVTELIPEREEELLTYIFEHLDARGRGRVRLDEALFHMTENAQVSRKRTK